MACLHDIIRSIFRQLELKYACLEVRSHEWENWNILTFEMGHISERYST